MSTYMSTLCGQPIYLLYLLIICFYLAYIYITSLQYVSTWLVYRNYLYIHVHHKFTTYIYVFIVSYISKTYIKNTCLKYMSALMTSISTIPNLYCDSYSSQMQIYALCRPWVSTNGGIEYKCTALSTLKCVNSVQYMINYKLIN